MIYPFYRNLVKISLHFYLKRIGWHGVENIPKDKPVLFCGTHANSFLDALPTASFLWQPLYVMTRGDAFRAPLANRIFRSFKMLPIFRQQEGEADYTTKNELTFGECQNLFKENQYVMIYPEGICKHQTEVLPFKKGAAVMALRAWTDGIDLQVLPTSASYDGFKNWGKKADFIFLKPLTKDDFDLESPTFATEFNEKLRAQLQSIYPSPYDLDAKPIHWGIFGQIMYYLGWILHFPLYGLVKILGEKMAGKTYFHDSVILGLIAVLLPVYYICVATALYIIL
jgi:1-acyl-sn-glycerol-3-phosphate acyltransferase